MYVGALLRLGKASCTQSSAGLLSKIASSLDSVAMLGNWCRRRHAKTPKVLGGGQCFEPPLRRINDILDADLLAAYVWLPVHQQEALATRCAVARQTILQSVLQLMHAVRTMPHQV